MSNPYPTKQCYQKSEYLKVVQDISTVLHMHRLWERDSFVNKTSFDKAGFGNEKKIVYGLYIMEGEIESDSREKES